MKQFPLDLAYAKTVHNVQGMTADSIILVDWPISKHGLSQWVYVALSRVKQEKGLFLMQELKPSLHGSIKPDPLLVAFLQKVLTLENDSWNDLHLPYEYSAENAYGLQLPTI